MDTKKPRTPAEIKVFQLLKGGKDDPNNPSPWQLGYEEGHFEGRHQGQREGFDESRSGTLEKVIEYLEARREQTYHYPDTETDTEWTKRQTEQSLLGFLVTDLGDQLRNHKAAAKERAREDVGGMEDSWLDPQDRGR